MKRFILVNLLLIFFSFIVNASAYVIDGKEYTDYFLYMNDDDGVYHGFYYNGATAINWDNSSLSEGNPLVIRNQGGYQVQISDSTSPPNIFAIYACDNVEFINCNYYPYGGTIASSYYMNSVFYGTLPNQYVPENRQIFSSKNIVDINDNIIFSTTPLPVLTIVIDPIDGGDVSVGEIPCTTCPCIFTLSEVKDSDMVPTANEGYAFGYWKSTSSPNPVTPKNDTEITAKFFKTFRDATDPNGTGFKQSSGYFGECLEYVEYETELPNDVCTYSAVNCLGQASIKGYATGSTPKVGAIIIYNQGANPMDYGHAGIVESINETAGTMIIHESNWNGDGYVHNTRSEEISDSKIMGYIYPVP